MPDFSFSLEAYATCIRRHGDDSHLWNRTLAPI